MSTPKSFHWSSDERNQIALYCCGARTVGELWWRELELLREVSSVVPAVRHNLIYCVNLKPDVLISSQKDLT